MMIDIETEVLALVRDSVSSLNIPVYNDLSIAPASYPCVYIEEIDNSVYRNGTDSGAIENFANITYQVEVYSNRMDGRRQEAKSIMSKVDEALSKAGFVRRGNGNFAFAYSTAYRLVNRYSAVAGSDNYIYVR